MALSGRYIVDTSVASRAHLPQVRTRLLILADNDLLVGCSIVDLEVGCSARTARAHDLAREARSQIPLADIGQSTCDRAMDIQSVLAAKGQHRLPIPDLLIAACALEHDLTVLHYDSDFDTIAAATGLRSQWVAPRGSL